MYNYVVQYQSNKPHFRYFVDLVNAQRFSKFHMGLLMVAKDMFWSI